MERSKKKVLEEGTHGKGMGKGICIAAKINNLRRRVRSKKE